MVLDWYKGTHMDKLLCWCLIKLLYVYYDYTCIGMCIMIIHVLCCVLLWLYNTRSLYGLPASVDIDSQYLKLLWIHWNVMFFQWFKFQLKGSWIMNKQKKKESLFLVSFSIFFSIVNGCLYRVYEIITFILIFWVVK